jgi:hypothetical protein
MHQGGEMGEVGAIEQGSEFVGKRNRHEDRPYFQVSWTNLPLQRVLTRLDTLHTDNQVSHVTRLWQFVLGRFARGSQGASVCERLSLLLPLRELRSDHAPETGRIAIQIPHRRFVHAGMQHNRDV